MQRHSAKCKLSDCNTADVSVIPGVMRAELRTLLFGVVAQLATTHLSAIFQP